MLIQKRKEKWDQYHEYSGHQQKVTFYFDPAAPASRPKGSLDQSTELGGITLETLFFQHLKAWLDYKHEDGKLYFWRTKGGLEVDFVIYGEVGFYAIEVKHAATIQPCDLKSLIEFKRDYDVATCILLYQGKAILQKGEVLCYPVEKILLELDPS